MHTGNDASQIRFECDNQAATKRRPSDESKKDAAGIARERARPDLRP